MTGTVECHIITGHDIPCLLISIDVFVDCYFEIGEARWYECQGRLLKDWFEGM